jgi:plastocyanin
MTLDSRVLTYLDCYAKKFSRAGRVEYRLLPGAGACVPEDAAFTIDVSGREEGEGRQHDVEVRFVNRALTAEPEHLDIQPADIVLWHANDPTVPGFTIRGTAPDGDFNSGAMEEEAVFTHAFGSAGSYDWVDAYAGAVRGTVEVVDPEGQREKDCAKWIESLGEGALVHISGGKVKPERIQILTGQTVFWAVEKAAGISITDSRLVSGAPKPPSRRGTERK